VCITNIGNLQTRRIPSDMDVIYTRLPRKVTIREYGILPLPHLKVV